MPSEFLMFWMGLISNKELSLNSDSGFKNQKRSKKEKVSEIEGRESAEASYVDLNKKKEEENLIMHSFEKLNTVEDYSGGLRKVDDSDELNDQENAMKDLQMSSITRSEEDLHRFIRDGLKVCTILGTLLKNYLNLNNLLTAQNGIIKPKN